MNTYRIQIEKIKWFGGFETGWGEPVSTNKLTKNASNDKEILAYGYKIASKSEKKPGYKGFRIQYEVRIIREKPKSGKVGFDIQIGPRGEIRAWPHVPFARGYLLKADGTMSGRGIE